MAFCKECGNKIKFYELSFGVEEEGSNNVFCEKCWKKIQNESGKTEEEKEQYLKLEIQNKIKNIIISTGDLKTDYEIIDVVFAIDRADEGLLGALMQKTINISFGADPGKAFSKVKDQLRLQCQNLGGNAVINCQFEHRVAAGRGIGGSGIGVTQVVEIFAYGTAVRCK